MAYFNSRPSSSARNMYNRLMPARRPMQPQVQAPVMSTQQAPMSTLQRDMLKDMLTSYNTAGMQSAPPIDQSMTQTQRIAMEQPQVQMPAVMPTQLQQPLPQVNSATPAQGLMQLPSQLTPEMQQQMQQFEQVMSSIPEVQQLRQFNLSTSPSQDQINQMRALQASIESNPQVQQLRQTMEQSRAQFLQSNPNPYQQGIGTLTPLQTDMLTTLNNQYQQTKGTVTPPAGTTPSPIPAMPPIGAPASPSTQGIGSLQMGGQQQQATTTNPFASGSSPNTSTTSSTPSAPTGLF